jgi:SAM-dependent methyltransferase
MSGYWSRRFAQEGMIWGSEPSPTAQTARNIFRQYNVKSVLVPGSGYGRNTKVFSEEFKTLGVELSVEALKMATEWDPMSHFILGSVLDTIFEEKVDAVYCYDVLHLFLKEDRRRLVANCLEQLQPDGLLYFTSFSDEDANNGIGTLLEPGTYEYKEGKYAHFFSDEDLREHFEGMDIVESGSSLEILRGPLGRTHSYILRYIVARKSQLTFTI